METRKILVTGGAGFMGSWLVDELLTRGHAVSSIDSLLGGKRTNINPDCRFVKADLRNYSRLKELVKGIDIIFHLAAYAAEGQSVFSPIAINDINTTPMNRLLVEAVNNGVKRFVFVSSMAVYGNGKPPFDERMPREPVDPYGVGKTYCESMLEVFARHYGFEFVILRPHNVYGPRQNTSDPYRNVLAIWMNRILRKLPPIIYGDGHQTRAFSYVGDVTPTIANAGFRPRAASQTINVGSDEVISVSDACRIVLDTAEANLAPIHERERPGEVKHAWCTVQKSIDLLGYETRTSLEAGVSKMWSWIKSVGPQKPSYMLPLEITKNAPRVWLEERM